MQEMILCKLGEVVLKGLNRRSFEMKLMSNIRRRTQRFGKFRIYSRQSTIYVEPCEESCDLEGAYDACKKVFGIIAITRAQPCEKSKEAILETAKLYLADALRAAKSFKVETKRADKSFPMGSIQVSQWVGGELHDAFPHLRVDVHHPELTVYVEIREDAAYVHAPAESAAGGLPLGMGGHAVSLLSGGIDSPVSSYMIAKRGVQLEMIHFASPPYTSDLAREKVLRLALVWAAERVHHPLYRDSGGDPPQLPGGVFHAHYAPLHDAPCKRAGARAALPRACDGRKPRSGREPDHAGPRRERGRHDDARPAPAHRP